MIRVTIEVIPHGEEENKFTLHTLEIANRGIPKRTVEQMVYDARFKVGEPSDERDYEIRLDGGEWMEGVRHYRTKPIWVLLRKVMEVLC